MKSSSIFNMLTLVCLCCLSWGCAGQTDVEPASSEGGGAEPAASAGGPQIPNSMVPGFAGPGDMQVGDQPPAPNYPTVQPPATISPAFDPDLPTADPSAAAGGERVVAEAGVGKQGQSLKDEQGIGAMIVQPARSLFAVKQRVVFEVEIPKALQFFEATEGRKPKSHEEYMSKVIKQNLIKLPELPAGQSYLYDPALGELMVQKSGG